jgi:hypothetical protein
VAALQDRQLELIEGNGSFGPLSEHQKHAMERLRERFFPERTPAELVPQVEPLPRYPRHAVSRAADTGTRAM